jgi:hypothetical protein
MSFGDLSGYPTWEDYIPEFKTQTLIMSIMASMSYQSDFKIVAAILDDDNNFIKLGTTIYFTADGQYKVLQPDEGNKRIRLSYEDGSLVSRYYQYPIPGINPNIASFDFSTNYKPGLPPEQVSYPPSYISKLPCKDDITCLTGINCIAHCVPNPGQPFVNRSKIAPNVGVNVYGYFEPPPPPRKNNPFVIAFHCINNYKASSNNPLDTLQYFQFQTLVIRTKGESPNLDFGDGVDKVNEDGDLIDRDGNPITVMTYINEVDYLTDFLGKNNPTYGYNLTYNSFVFSFRGSRYLPDFLEEVVPPEILISDLKLSNPESLLSKYRPWLVNKATTVYKSIAKDTNFSYFLTPFPENEYINTRKNYSLYLGSTCFTGHSYGGSLANIAAQYLVERFPGYVNIQTYAFGPVPYLRKSVPIGDVSKYIGYLYIRGFTNDNDPIPFLKVPNLLNEAQDYVQPLESADEKHPPLVYNFYRIKSLECGSKCILERINSYSFTNGGVPVYLSVNKDHFNTTYVDNISKIDDANFHNTVISPSGIIDYTISNSDLISTFIETIPYLATYSQKTKKTIDAASSKNPIHILYNFIGFNDIDINFKNLIQSLKL